MTVAVSMVSKTAKDAIVVPADAVFKTDEGANYVLVAGADEKAHQKKVQVGIRSAERAQVLSGINAGDPVITTGGYGIPDGTQIKVEEPGAEDKESAAKGDKDDDTKGAKGDPEASKDKNKSDKKDSKSGAAAKPADKGKE
jgi:HlyD family secretion protein